MALIHISPAGFGFSEAPGQPGFFMLTFGDHVGVQGDNGQPRMVPTGIAVEIGPIAADDVRAMCQQCLDQLSPLSVPKPIVLRPDR